MCSFLDHHSGDQGMSTQVQSYSIGNPSRIAHDLGYLNRPTRISYLIGLHLCVDHTVVIKE